MAFSTAGSNESVLLASQSLDDSELVSSLGGICFRRFQKKHISLGSSKLPGNFCEAVLGSDATVRASCLSATKPLLHCHQTPSVWQCQSALIQSSCADCKKSFTP